MRCGPNAKRPVRRYPLLRLGNMPMQCGTGIQRRNRRERTPAHTCARSVTRVIGAGMLLGAKVGGMRRFSPHRLGFFDQSMMRARPDCLTQRRHQERRSRQEMGEGLSHVIHPRSLLEVQSPGGSTLVKEPPIAKSSGVRPNTYQAPEIKGAPLACLARAEPLHHLIHPPETPSPAPDSETR